MGGYFYFSFLYLFVPKHNENLKTALIARKGTHDDEISVGAVPFFLEQRIAYIFSLELEYTIRLEYLRREFIN